MSSTQAPANPRTQRIEWTCDICRKPVKDGTGYLSLNDAKLHAYEQAHRRYDQRQATARAAAGGRLIPENMRGLMALPAAVRWEVLHRACDPDPDAGSYWFAIERIRTASQVLDWTAHLFEKCWFQSTAWNALLRFVAKQLNNGREVDA